MNLSQKQITKNDIIVINPIKKSQSAPSFKEIQKANTSSGINRVIEEIKVYTEEEHLMDKSDEIKELYDIYKEAILNLSTEIVPRKQHIALKKDKILLIFIFRRGA